MPFKESPEDSLGESFYNARGRFLNLEKKLNKNLELKQKYVSFIKKYQELGHLSEVDRPSFGFYLPHHAVVREEKETTKLRVVFDASAKSSSGKSLNDIQYVGPVVQSDLFSILLRFRIHKFVLTGDVEKMYRQIEIHPSQRHLQLILWRENEEQSLKTLKLNTVTYGMASAPHLATRCLLQFVCDEARVAPLKTLTIPRLELCGALLGARLCAKVEESLTCNIINKTMWTDSKVVLGWLRTQSRNLKTFLLNRVIEINDLTKVYVWMHVPTDQNPADLASRGVEPQELQNSTLWWRGPSFLLKEESEWPSQGLFEVNNLPELKVFTCTKVENEINNCSLVEFEKYSRYDKLKRIVAYVLRFVNKCRKKAVNNDAFEPDELENSMMVLVKQCQLESFANDIYIIAKNKRLHLKSKLLPLDPFIDTLGILRVGGRLQNSNFDFNKKHPILLDGKHHFSKILMRHEHIRLLHAGPQLLLAAVREEFWPIGGRNLARSVTRKCVICTRMRGQVITPIMGTLPSVRLSSSFAFDSCGIDFAGPFLIANRKGRGSNITKCFLALFVCLQTKALHLETVSSMSTDAFLLCLRRFVSRRGRPQVIYCDNGTNFVGAKNELGRVIKASRQSVSDYASAEKIKFVFSPAYAPHFGGIWEAGIKSAKNHLKRVASNASLTFEELATLFTQIEAILNSRPLSPLSSDPTDLNPLTPGHFLIGRPLMSVPSLPVTTKRPNRYETIEQLRQHFWERWRREFIAELQQRMKWRTRQRDLAVGDMVVLKEDQLPPLRWRLGRIAQLYAGPDGVNRVADITTTKGTMRRAYNKICLLPTAPDA